ncbi:class I SAM-dependent methyltransferase [Virgibacillus sp. 179-BFC.A HS]|uniref:Class I SAM-dependent methyltransferase n=1 Tax=Tigheibacillus jepli TaxID=3035914 RepID=A0ABU5CCK5_9BACI|nr:class I SAM-dependent methyltransferase [Virgibacillus sp. 179-BFC.A HS]MDY0404059.1 class I SAM-dependent methyltransferase [Virgibacillus sp. 179-BFC.A HS]
MLDQQVDAIVSSYALHHLTDSDKLLALAEMDRTLKIDGQICIADLMFANENRRSHVINHFRDTGNHEAIDAIEDEYYANRQDLVQWLIEHGYQVQTYALNDILSIIYAVKRADLSSSLFC